MILFALFCEISAIPIGSMQGLANGQNDFNSAVAEVAKQKNSDDPIWEGTGELFNI